MASPQLNLKNIAKNTSIPLGWVVSIVTITFGASMAWFHLKNDAIETLKSIGGKADTANVVTRREFQEYRSHQSDTVNALYYWKYPYGQWGH